MPSNEDLREADHWFRQGLFAGPPEKPAKPPPEPDPEPQPALYEEPLEDLRDLEIRRQRGRWNPKYPPAFTE